MQKKSSFLLWLPLLLFPLLTIASTATISSTNVNFYTESIDLKYDTRMVVDTRICVKGKCLTKYVDKMAESGYEVLLNDLLKEKERLQLNDWLFYDLMRRSVNKIYKQEEEMQRVLTCWWLLSKAGYNTRIAHIFLKDAFLYVQCNDAIYDAPFSTEDDKKFINLTAVYHNVKTVGLWFQITKFDNIGGNKSFNVNLDQLPKIKPTKIKKTLDFKCGGDDFSLDIMVDKNPSELMKSYPRMENQKYIEVPLSQTLYQSLIPQLKTMLDGKSDADKMRALVSLTRSSFKYKWDYDLFDKNKPLIADELFFNEYSDHEDRTALLFCLTKELVQKPILLIGYMDYVTIGIALEEEVGQKIPYNGITYYVCDPTMPSNSCEIGKFPNGLRKNTLEVIAEYGAY